MNKIVFEVLDNVVPINDNVNSVLDNKTIREYKKVFVIGVDEDRVFHFHTSDSSFEWWCMALVHLQTAIQRSINECSR